LGESDDLVDVLSPRIIEVEPIYARRIHSILPGLAEGCRLVKVPHHFIKQGRSWHVEQQLYSIPPEGEAVELSEPKLAYSIEGRNVIFDGDSR
jgi:CRISPR-associated protein Cas5h